MVPLAMIGANVRIAPLDENKSHVLANTPPAADSPVAHDDLDIAE
jgi:hypothetical protein